MDMKKMDIIQDHHYRPLSFILVFKVGSQRRLPEVYNSALDVGNGMSLVLIKAEILIPTMRSDVRDALLDGWGHCVVGLALVPRGLDGVLEESVPAGAATLFLKLQRDRPGQWGRGPLETPCHRGPLDVHRRESRDLFSLGPNNWDNYATICGCRTHLTPRVISIVCSVELSSAEKKGKKGH